MAAPRLYRERGVVLRTYRLAEADRIVVLATRGRGKVRAVAKGVRRTSSRMGGRLEPLCHVALQCWAGRELDRVTQVDTIEPFPGLRSDLHRLQQACTLAEVCDQLLQEQHANPRLFEMLVGALRVLDQRDPALLVAGFLCKALAADGSGPVLDRCAACGAAGPLVAFDLLQGGALCRACRRGRPVSAEALALLRQMLGGGLAVALEVPPGPVATEVTELATEAMEAHLDRRIRSAHVVPPAAIEASGEARLAAEP